MIARCGKRVRGRVDVLSVHAVAALSSQLVGRWSDAKPGSFGAHARVGAHAAAVTGVIYLSGWGPELGMAYAFSSFADLEQSGASTWRAALGWSVTGLPNRQLLVDRLTHAIDKMRRRGDDAPVVMFCDLNRFKLVNDTFGHQTAAANTTSRERPANVRS